MRLSAFFLVGGLLVSMQAIGQTSVPPALSNCQGCHLLTEPDYDNAGRAERMSRTAPPLFFAGNKYKRDWLEQWLAEPYPLYPVGYIPAVDRVVSTPEGDEVPAEALAAHVAVDAAEAAVLADALMTLRPYDHLIDAVTYEPGSVALRMGVLDFRRFKGCDACHRDTEDSGGLSGPELVTAWQRLQPDFIAAFIANPVEWDRNTIMPIPQMNEAAVHKLADYLKALGESQ